MAATGFTPLSLYYSATTTNAPTAGNLVNGELAINIIDGKLFYKDNSGVVQVIATKSATSGIFLGTGAITVPVGTTAQEPTGVQGMLRFNTTTGSFEGYNGTVWGAIGGGGASTITRTDFTATSGQTVFTISYVAGAIDVYRNGIKLANADYTATNGTSVTLATGAITGDLIECVVYSVIAIAATVSTFSGGSTGLTPATATSGAVTLAGTLGVSNGGTGSFATPNNGGVAFGNAGVFGFSAAGTSGQPLLSGGSTAPSFGALAIGTANTNISGALTATNGGTGVATLSGIAFGNGTSTFTAASAAQVVAVISTTAVANATNAATVTTVTQANIAGAVAPSTSGNVLTSNGTAWTSATPAGGGVTSLNGQTGAITNTSLYAIGSYILGRPANTTTYSPNTTIAGSALYGTCAGANYYSVTPGWNSSVGTAGQVLINTGTWQLMSGTGAAVGNFISVGLWVRIS